MLVTDRARERGETLGFTSEQIMDMAHRAARLTHPLGNARFTDYWFTIFNEEIKAMGLLGPNQRGSRVCFIDAMECDFCDGTMMTVMVDIEDRSEEIIKCPRMKDRTLPLCNRM